jgi:mRNA interferase MazF
VTPARGDIWLFDLGMAEKVRPALVISAAFGDADRALVTVVPHTTSLRGSEFEIPVSVPFLKPGAFVVQGVSTYPHVRAIRKLGALKPAQFDLVFAGVLRWLGVSRTVVSWLCRSVLKLGLPASMQTFTHL